MRVTLFEKTLQEGPVTLTLGLLYKSPRKDPLLEITVSVYVCGLRFCSYYFYILKSISV